MGEQSSQLYEKLLQESIATALLRSRESESRQLHEKLLKEWEFRREMVHFYSTALLRLSPDDRNARQRWRELNEKLATARIALTHAADQLQTYDRGM